MEYLLKASAIIAIFYICYKLFLQRDTFFESNRGFLLIGLISTFLIPFVVIPVYIERTPVSLNHLVFNEVATPNLADTSISFLEIAFYIYTIGVLFFICRLLVHFASLVQVLIKNESTTKGRYTYIQTKNTITPFSFFKWIVYNPEQFNEQELRLILIHEKVHARQYHTFDILFTQLACIVLWFNPFIWLYNKDLKQNLEFIADQNAHEKSNCKKSYQYTLLKTSMPSNQLALTNNFYNSLIKKRIVMLHKTKSKKTSLLKYTLVIPVLVIFLMSFNTKKVFIDTDVIPEEEYIQDTFEDSADFFIQENAGSEVHEQNFKSPNQKEHIAQSKKDTEVFLISKHFTNAEFDKLAENLKEKGITAKFKGIKRNDNNEITAIKIELKSKHANANFSVDSSDSINSIKISFEGNGKNIAIGNSSYHSDIVHITKDGKHSIHKQSKNNTFTFSHYDDNHVKIRKHADNKEIVTDDHEDGVKVIIENNGDADYDDEDIIISKKGDKDKKVKIIKSRSNSTIFTRDDDKEPLFIVDGKEVEKAIIEDIDSDQIASIFVLKDEQAREKYGDKGKDGVIELLTKDKGHVSSMLKVSDDALYILDGKEVDKTTIEDLDPDDIESIDVYKGEGAIKKHGDKGKNGVISVTSKKQK